jgi:hypothetical protein
MKKLVLALLGAATLAMSSNALALDTTKQYAAVISRGPGPAIPVGVLSFVFWGDLPAGFVPGVGNGGLPGVGQCQYMAEWDDFYSGVAPTGGLSPLGLSGQILVDEEKTVGSFSCLQNSMMPTFSAITLDNSYGPSFPNMGFDQFQQVTTVTQLALGESGWSSEGLIQYYGPPIAVYSFMLNSI